MKYFLFKKNWLLLALLLGGLFGIGIYQPIKAAALKIMYNYKLTEGLVLHLTFDGQNMDWSQASAEARDATNNGGNGNVVNLNQSAVTPGAIGQGLQFDGFAGYISVSDGTGSSMDSATGAGQARTWSYWIYWQGGENRLITDKSGFYGYHFWSESHTIGFHRIYGGVTTTGSVNSATLTVNNWYLITFTYDGTNTRVYTNGVLSGGPTAQTAPADDNSALLIGGSTGSTYTTPGILDDVRIYNRALSQEEITYLYKITSPKNKNIINKSQKNVLTSGLVSYWTFDGQDTNFSTNVTNDVSNNGNNGVLLNMSTSTNPTQGIVGQALSFDGVDDYINVGSGSSLDNLTTFTVSVWINPSTIPPTNTYGRIFEKPDTGGSLEGLRLEVRDCTATTCGITASRNYDGTDALTQQGTLITNGVWTHVVFTYDETGDRKIYYYINGVKRTSYAQQDASTGTIVSDANYNGFIGNEDASPEYSFRGNIDELRIYNKVLSNEEISYLYNLSAPQKRGTINTSQNSQLTQGLAAYWSFNGGTMDWSQASAEVRDSLGGSNHGNVIGTTSKAAQPGISGQALQFDGLNDYIDFGDLSSLLGSNTEGTVSLWVKKESGVNGTPLYYGQSDTNNNLFRLVFTADTTLQVLLKSTSDFYRGTVDLSDVNNGKWHHLLFVVNSSGNTLYYDGAPVTITYTAGNSASTEWFDDITTEDKLSVGFDPLLAGAGNYFKGSIDEVRVYNRALTTSEIDQLYRMGRR